MLIGTILAPLPTFGRPPLLRIRVHCLRCAGVSGCQSLGSIPFSNSATSASFCASGRAMNRSMGDGDLPTFGRPNFFLMRSNRRRCAAVSGLECDQIFPGGALSISR